MRPLPALQGVVTIDGKTLGRAYERGQSQACPPIMVTAGGANPMALANVLTKGDDEAAAALQLIGL